LKKRYYIFVARHDWDGQLRRTPIPVQWVALFLICAVVGLGTIVGFAGSYGRMLTKVEAFNEVRRQEDLLTHALSQSRKNADQYKAEVASLGSLASEVSALYNFKHSSSMKDRLRNALPAASLEPVSARVATPADAPGVDNPAQASALYASTLSSFQLLENTALENSIPRRGWSPFDPRGWQPDIWPVRGRITSSFGERTDPFLGEGAFHAGIDIAVPVGTPIHVTADGLVIFAGWMTGYGRTVIVSHGHGLTTLYAHMSALAVTVGQHLDRDEVVGYVGVSGWSTGPHLHYEVRINRTPVNPYRYLGH
jgi:murein DD-endopeptidase MepM/ murein hydrolase activator NlpD